jgi:dienelactone hydrolase
MSAANTRVPGIIIRPEDSAKHAAVICLHGTGGNKDSELPMMRKLAKAGFIAIAIDAPYHGERTRAAATNPAAKGTDDYQQAIIKAFHGSGEHPLFFDTVRDVSRLIDYLEYRGDVDMTRIGLYGVSKGGIETYLAAAVEPRIAVAVPCIGVQSFKWALENNAWQPRVNTIPVAFKQTAKDAGYASPDAAFVKVFYNRVVPRIDSEFDAPQMLPLIAPRPLLIINGDSDVRTPLPGLQLCIDSAKAAYHAQNADDKLKVIIQPNTAHKVNPDSEDAAISWFVQWLQP